MGFLRNSWFRDKWPRRRGGDSRPDRDSDRGGETSAPAGARKRPFLEIQYHPGDIRRQVRYLFLSQRQVVGWSSGILAWVLFLAFAVAVTPRVVGNQWARQQYEELQSERTLLGNRLKELSAELERIEAVSSQTMIEMEKIHLAYGLPRADGGQGGYPEPADLDLPEIRSIYGRELRHGHGLLNATETHMNALRVFLEEVQSFETAHQDQVRTTPSISPVRREHYVMTSPFGTRRSPFTNEIDFHAGLDLAAAVGTPIYAPADGVVTFAGQFPLRSSVAWWRYGQLVAIKNGERFMTLYAHCEEIMVKPGNRVVKGQQIATVGNTGWSTNPHLHYEIRYLDEEGEWHPIDPRIYILDQTWRDEEKVLIQARKAPSPGDYEPLPRAIGR